ncbi:MAG TPA: acyl-[ACP]--phospholipid O-acyltransferase [Geomonas sp.]|nr:acyl-[ACP]--phospholipid O-acyltransferase [Geomonas sp.]
MTTSIGWLNLTQFLGALNDNILKLLIIFYLIGSHGSRDAGIITALVGACFVLPFLIFSAPAGCLADRFAKSRIMTAVKVVEVLVTALAVMALYLGSQGGVYAAVFLMATHSALFAPAKYGSLPELVDKAELSRANGLLESCTFLAIIIGTCLASLLAQLTGGKSWLAACACLLIALAGLWSACRIPATRASDPSRTVSLVPTEILKTLSEVRRDRDLTLAITGLAYFMFIGAFAQLNLISYGIERLGLTGTESGYLFLAAALGIGLGSLLAAKLSGRSVEFGVVPIGAAGLALAPVLLHLAPNRLAPCLAIILCFGISAGLFSLPLQTFIQFRAEPARRGEVLAASTFANWVAILAASLVSWLFSGPLGLSAAQGFSMIGVLTLFLTAISFRVLPDFLLRFLALTVVRCCYRLRVVGSRHLPADGPALLVPNHVSWLDALLLTATSQRRIRFVMDRKIYDLPLLNGLFRLLGVIPVSGADGRKEIVEFIRQARTALDEGFLVCIFAEGEITRNGMLREFRAGFERIVRGTGYPVIPVYIGGAWGSILSYAHGKLLSRFPSPLPYPVSVLFGEPMPAESSAVAVRQAVSELSCDYFDSLKAERLPLGDQFLACARKNWNRRALADTTGTSLTYGRTAAGALALAGKLDNTVDQEKHVGLLLPPSAGGVLANLALTLLGRVPVNLNYTAAESSLRSALGQCGITTVITSRAFLARLPSLPVLPGTLFLEDLLASISGREKLVALIKARLFPVRQLCRREDFHADQPATVIFSSGSTGEPKGVVLSHHNIISNIEALRTVFRVETSDNICSALPFFHSLGFTGTLWFPLVSGFSAAYHSNPLDGEKIAQVVRGHKSTLLLATPTFLTAYLRRARREDFASLRMVVTGAEKLGCKLADAFQERFGIRPLEGYGATELSPVITLSLPEVEVDGIRQYGAKEGSVGHPVPGVAVRVVDPETGAPLKPGEAGMILVKGANLMLGYLGRPEQTAQVIKDGWYVTGDIGMMDEDGFLRITDRLARFSKIAGEMVPHGVVEEELQKMLGKSGVLAVTALPDQKKGEKLAVVYAREAADADSLCRLMSESRLPNLWKPGRDCYFGVESLPLLGSGKLDLRAVKELALAGQ